MGIKQSSRFVFGVAETGDDAELRALFRSNPMQGKMSVAFEREPSFFFALATQGDFHQVVAARELATHRIIGIGTRSVGQAFLNGSPSAIGYLSDLRLDPAFRGRTLVARGYRFFHQLHNDERTQLYYTVIFADNKNALRTIAAGRAGLPSYHDCGLIRCPGINLWRKRPPIATRCEILRGNLALLPEIVECLNRNNQHKQFAPVHSLDSFLHQCRWRDFRVEDFYVARYRQRIVGVIGKWDQRAFKQTRVLGYRQSLRWLRPLANAVHPLLGTPRLPDPGKHVAYFYVSFIAIDDDDPNVFRALLRQVHNDAIGGDYLYFLIGLHERNPLAEALKDYSVTPFSGRLFCVCFEENKESLCALDERVPHIEIATL